ncbi:hypothetical protein Hanom_Chr14g01276581 [Helianthus anomalus]
MVRFDQMLVEAYDLQLEQRYPFAKKVDVEVNEKEVKADEKDVTKNVNHNSKSDPVGEKKFDVEVGPETAPVAEEIPVNASFNADFAECMNIDVGPETVPVVDTSDIEKYYIETDEWGQTQQSQPGINSPMVSQYGSTPQASQSDDVLL